MLLGSMDRGNKVFKHSNWEASQLYNVLEETNLNKKVPISGMFGLSSFGKVAVGEAGSPADDRFVTSIMEADSVYAILMKKGSSKLDDIASSADDLTATTTTSTPAQDNYAGTLRDECTAFELAKYNDEADMVIVEKRDPESAAPVRVATMDYVIPEKAPQPSNVLESMVWDREQAVDRMRERFQLSKALMQATRSELKFPVRKLSDALTVDNMIEGEFSADGTLNLLVEFNRATLHNGKISDQSLGDTDVSRQAGAKTQIEKFSESIQNIIAAEKDLSGKGLRLVAVGAHADTGTFRGSYEDVESLRETQAGKTFPVLCNDFVLYAYQLFKAKSSGADAVKLHASILPVNEISYMAKIAKKISLEIVVVVSSVPQLLEVINKVPELEILSISSRNMRLWKISRGKGKRILANEDVRAALALRRLADPVGAMDKKRLLVVCEGVSASEEIVALRGDPLVDGVLLAEELVAMQLPVHEAVRELVKVE